MTSVFRSATEDGGRARHPGTTSVTPESEVVSTGSAPRRHGEDDGHDEAQSASRTERDVLGSKRPDTGGGVDLISVRNHTEDPGDQQDYADREQSPDHESIVSLHVNHQLHSWGLIPHQYCWSSSK